jgi:hypothetical protein
MRDPIDVGENLYPIGSPEREAEIRLKIEQFKQASAARRQELKKEIAALWHRLNESLEGIEDNPDYINLMQIKAELKIIGAWPH